MENTLPSPTGTGHQQNSAEEGRAEVAQPKVQIHLVQHSWETDSWRWLPLQVSLIMADWLPKQKRLGRGMAENGVGRTPGI